MRIKIFLFVLLVFNGFAGCNKPSDGIEKEDTNEEVRIVVFYTNDEHGWMEPSATYGGAAGLMSKWKHDGYDGSDNYLILSGGDMWTGPAASTWFKGESMAKVMSAMEYDAAAVGNHEFDFKVEKLKERLVDQGFPFLSANIIVRSTGEVPDFVQPYLIKEIEGVKVGIIGLSSQSTPHSTFPTHVAEYSFTDYSEAIEMYAPLAKADGAEILFIIGHICSSEMDELLSVANKYGIALIGGGHCHHTFAEKKDDVLLIQSGSNMRAYVKVSFEYNKSTKVLKNIDSEIVPNVSGDQDAAVKEVVDYWTQKSNEMLSEIVGYTDRRISQSSNQMRNMVCDSWLHAFPNADVALTNAGGIRQSIEAGSISLATIVGLLPFENNILELDLTGTELLDVSRGLLKGGMQTKNGATLSDGTPIYSDSVYSVLTTDYLYALSSYRFSEYDDEPINTYIQYRQPLIDWLNEINTTISNPLSLYLDAASRN